jgi:hypothetical protein
MSCGFEKIYRLSNNHCEKLYNVYVMYCLDTLTCSNSAMSTTHFFCSFWRICRPWKMVMVIIMSVCPHGTTWLLVDRSSWHVILGIFIKLSRKFVFGGNWMKNTRHCMWRRRYIRDISLNSPSNERSWRQKWRKSKPLMGNAFCTNIMPFTRSLRKIWQSQIVQRSWNTMWLKKYDLHAWLIKTKYGYQIITLLATAWKCEDEVHFAWWRIEAEIHRVIILIASHFIVTV